MREGEILLFSKLAEEILVENIIFLGKERSTWVPIHKPFGKYFLGDVCWFECDNLVFPLRKTILFVYKLFLKHRHSKALFVSGFPYIDTLFLLGVVSKNFEKDLPRDMPYILRWIPGCLTNFRNTVGFYIEKDNLLPTRIKNIKNYNGSKQIQRGC